MRSRVSRIVCSLFGFGLSGRLLGVIVAGGGGRVFDCRAHGGSAAGSLLFQGGSATVAVHIELEDSGVMDEPIDGGEGHSDD